MANMADINQSGQRSRQPTRERGKQGGRGSREEGAAARGGRAGCARSLSRVIAAGGESRRPRLPSLARSLARGRLRRRREAGKAGSGGRAESSRGRRGVSRPWKARDAETRRSPLGSITLKASIPALLKAKVSTANEEFKMRHTNKETPNDRREYETFAAFKMVAYSPETS